MYRKKDDKKFGNVVENLKESKNTILRRCQSRLRQVSQCAADKCVKEKRRQIVCKSQQSFPNTVKEIQKKCVGSEKRCECVNSVR